MAKVKPEIEEVALELLVSIMEVRKAAKTLERAITFATKKGDDKLADMLSVVHSLVSDQGLAPLDAFYSAEMISDSIYDSLKLADEYGAMNTDAVKEQLEDKRTKEKMVRGALGEMAQPLVFIFLGSFVGVYIIKSFQPIVDGIYDGKQMPGFFHVYRWISEHYLIGSLGTAIVFSALAVFILYTSFRRIGAKEIALYAISTTLGALRQMNVPYHEIFSRLGQTEKDKDLREALMALGEETKTAPFAEVADLLLVHFPIAEAIILTDKIATGNDAKGWAIAKEKMLEVSRTKMMILSRLVPNIAYFFILFIILASLFPAGAAMLKMADQMSGSVGG